MSCTLLEPGHLGCPVGLEDVTPVPSGDGIPVSITFEPPVDLGGGSVLLGMSNLVPVGACTRSGTSGGLDVGPIACSPTGIGFFAHVNTDPGAGYTTISWQSGTERHACSADPSTPNRWNCQLPSVVPADISICGGNGSGTTCFPHPEILAALPSRCGGSPNSPTGWNLALGCFGSTSLRGNVTLSTGNTVLGVNENFNGSSSGLAADLGIPNAFVVSEDFPLVSGNREFCASFAGGTSECRTYTRDEVAAVAPVSCPQTGGGTPGIGGLCADNPSASGWQNPGNSFDVNNDGCVTAQDVLLLINALNQRVGDSSLVSPRPAGSAFVDVSGDGQLTPIDVLMVINYLNTHTGSACTPACSNGPETGAWGLSARCNPLSPDTIEITMTYPTGLGIFPAVINTVPGWSCVMPDLAGNSINCTFPVSLRGSGPLTWQFTGPAPDHATIPHTFTEYDTVVPRFCGSTPSRRPPTAGR